MTKHEHTSPRLAAEAAAILAMANEFVPDQIFFLRRKNGTAVKLELRNVVSWCASLVNQAEDKKPKRRSTKSRGRK